MTGFRCYGCKQSAPRYGLCQFCREAVIAMPPDQRMRSDEALGEIRALIGDWRELGVSFKKTDRLVILMHRLDRYLSSGGWLPEEWDPDSTPQQLSSDLEAPTLPPGSIPSYPVSGRNIHTVASDLL